MVAMTVRFKIDQCKDIVAHKAYCVCFSTIGRCAYKVRIYIG